MRAEQNEFLVRTGPGTPMGELFRRYWLPALKSSELKADGDPVRFRLLGENLIAFRDTQGRVGVMDHRCPHRCASLFFGRNEEEGLRCVYHGWKFDVTGRCVDMPSEPAVTRTSSLGSLIDAKPSTNDSAKLRARGWIRAGRRRQSFSRKRSV